MQIDSDNGLNHGGHAETTAVVPIVWVELEIVEVSTPFKYRFSKTPPTSTLGYTTAYHDFRILYELPVVKRLWEDKAERTCAYWRL